MKTIKIFLLLFSIGIFFACSSDDPTTEPTTPPVVSVIALTTDSTTLLVGESATLTVKNNSNVDITSTSTIKVDGTAISGNVFTPTVAGTFKLKATNMEDVSNEVTIVVTTPVTSIVIAGNKSEIAPGEKVVFTSTANNGQILTSQTTFYLDGVAQTGSEVIFPSEGVFTVNAKYTNVSDVVITSNDVQITVKPVINFNKRVLIEDFTGTWCGWCPRVAYGVEQVNAQTNDAVTVAIHQGNDPYNISVAPYSVSGYPTANLNRTTGWTYPEPSNVAQVVNLTNGVNPRLGLAISPSVSAGNLNIDVKVKFGYQFSGIKLVVYVLEDGLVYNQENYTSYYGGVSVIQNMTHNHVLRKVMTNINGDAITGSTVSGDEYSKNFNIAVPANVANSANMSIVAFVVDSNGKVINVRSADLGENQTFEIE